MSLFRLAFIAAVINIVVAVPSLDAQTMPPTSAEALLEPSDIKGQPADDFYKNLHEQTRRDTPRLIFIPGILGSIIKQCEADSTQCKIIWGDTDSLHKDVDLSIRDDKIYQTDVVDSYFFIDVYGSVITHIRNKIASITTETAADPMLTTFPYDWRLSNSVNATKLADRICDIRKAAPKSPIYILSHSMGGLIAKEWAAHYAAVQCPNGAEPNVEEIAFVATPHLGAPKAIKAVTSGYNLLFDEVDGIMHYFGIWETKHILFALNDAGMSFPSIYELLPIRSSEYCRHEKQNLSLTADPVDSEDGSPLNMFDVNTWKRYDLLRSRIESPTARKVFYETKLATLLREAEVRLCEIVDFDPSSVVKHIDYVYGHEKGDSTFGWFRLALDKENSIKDSSIVQGDDTVPLYSAQNYLVANAQKGRPAGAQQMREVESNHLKIISDPAVLAMIDEWYNNGLKHAELDVAKEGPRYAELLSRENAATGRLIPMSLDATKWATDDEKLAININSVTLSISGHKPLELAQIAAQALDPLERANLYAVAASTGTEEKDRLVWTGETAKWAYVASRFEDAKRSAVLASIAVNQSTEKNGPELIAVDQGARQTAGWSYLREGDLVGFSEVARDYASRFPAVGVSFQEPGAAPRGDEHHFMANWSTGRDIDWGSFNDGARLDIQNPWRPAPTVKVPSPD